MGINIAGGADIAVPQPLLNFLQAHAIGIEQTGAAVAQVVEADTLHLVCDQKIREMLTQKVGPNPLSHRVYIDIVKIIGAIAFAADLPILLLLLFHFIEHLLTGRDQRKGAAAGFRLGSIPRDIGHNAVNLCGNDCVLNADSPSIFFDFIKTNKPTADYSMAIPHRLDSFSLIFYLLLILWVKTELHQSLPPITSGFQLLRSLSANKYFC